MSRAVRLALLLCAATFALAQKPAPIELGLKPERVYDFGGIDNVNVFNGNVVVTIPLGMRYPLTANLDYGLTLVYNSKVWDYRYVDDLQNQTTEQWARPNLRSNAGVGWRMSMGRLLPPTGSTSSSYREDTRNDWVYEGPSGDEHAFAGNAYDLSAPIDADVQFTRGEPYLRMVRLSDTSRRIDFPDATSHLFAFERSAWRLRSIEDRFGHAVSVTYTYDAIGRVTQWHLDDSAGRSQVVTFVYKSVMGDSVDRGMFVSSIQLYGVGGTYAYSFAYTDIPVPYSCYHTYAAAPGNGSTTLPMLTGLSLPDGTSYSFTYETASTACASGLLKAIALPTRGAIEYAYQLYTMDGGCTPTGPRNSSPGIRTRTLDGNVRTYKVTRGPAVTAVNPNSSTPPDCGRDADNVVIPPNDSRRWSRTSIISPPGSDGLHTRSDHYFSAWVGPDSGDDPSLEAHDGALFNIGESLTAGWPGAARARLAPPELETASDVAATDLGGIASTSNRSLSAQLWTGCTSAGNCSSGDLLRSTYRRIESLAIDANAGRPVTSERTLFHDDTGCGGVCYVQSAQSDFDRVGHFRTTTRSSNFPGPSGDTTNIAYKAWSTSALQNPATPWALTQYSSKMRTLGSQVARSTYCFEPDGRLTRQRLLAGASEGTHDLITVFDYTAGNVTAERSYGGDLATVGLDANLCTTSLGSLGYSNTYTWANGVLASATATGTTFKSLDYVSHPSGVVTASRAPDLLPTTYAYDPWGRLRTVTPPGETPTHYTFTNATAMAAARIQAHRDPDVTLTYDYDSLGRLARTQRTLPGAGCVEQTLAYDAHGRRQSESVSKGCGTAGASTHYGYDGSGRVTRITAPDGKVATVAYTGAREVRRTAEVDGVAVTTAEEYDVFGRLVILREHAGTVGEVATAYTYDVGDRLSRVSMPSPAGTQTRLFTYDNRGLLLWEQHPELGATGNGSTEYEYDARGHVRRRTTGAIGLTYAYDSAERLRFILDAAGQELEQYVYDAFGNCVAPVCNGKLAAAVRYHYDPELSDSSGRLAVTEGYQYHAATGRVGRRDSAVGAHADFQGASFWLTQEHDSLGGIAAVTYPCRAGDCSGDRLRTVTNHYTNGVLSRVGNWASSITWHPSGTVNTVTHGSGTSAVRELWTPDPHGLARPRQIRATNASGSSELWSTGTYAYDGSGNITAIGATRYFYDAHQRLSGWSTSLPTLLTTATIGYDTFGNRLYSYEEGCTMNGGAPSVCWSPSYQASELRGTTNHYLHLSYDSAGNVTADATRTFEYDALGMMSRALVGGRDFRYLYTPGGERIAAVERANVAGTIENRITYTVRGFENQLLTVWKSGAAGTLAWSEDLIWRGSALLANETPSGTRHTILDHLGSPRLLAAGATGLAVGTQSFQPFGEGGTLDAGPLQFTAHERDAALFGHGTADLPDYMHARFYDPNMGRFLSVDPVLDIKRSIREPQSWNRYSYVVNNPIRRIDPDGRVDGNSDDFARQLYPNDRAAQLAFDQDVGVKTAGLAAAFGSLFVPGPEDLVFAAAGATRLGRAIGWVGDKIAGAFGRGADDTLQKIFEVQRGKGNFGLGSMSGEKADKIGRAWVGDTAKPLMRDGKQIGLISEDGSKVYRFGAQKTKSGRYQANIEEVTTSATGKRKVIRNAHIDIIQ